jgi:hypothetical protein
MRLKCWINLFRSWGFNRLPVKTSNAVIPLLEE